MTERNDPLDYQEDIKAKANQKKAKQTVDEYKVKMYRDYRKVFGTVAGKRVLEDLGKVCFLKATTYSPDPHRMAFNEGQRVMLLHITNTMEYKPNRKG